MPPAIVKGHLPVSKGSCKTILVCWSIVGLISPLVPGCSAPRQGADVYLEAIALRGQGQTASAIEKLMQVLEVERDFVLAYSDLGRAYLEIGDLERAAGAFEKATTLDRWSFTDHMDLGRVYQEQSKFAEAARIYERAAELAPENVGTQLAIARCHLKAGDPARALAHAESARQMDKRSPEVLRVLGQVYEAQGGYDRAVVVYRQLSELNPEAPDGLLAIALAHIRNGKYDEAREILVSVLQRWPREATAFRQLAYCLLKLGATDQSIEMYERAIEMQADDWQAHRGLGVAYMVKCRQRADDRLQSLALHHWRQALAIYPDQPRCDVLQKLIKEHSTMKNPLEGLDY